MLPRPAGFGAKLGRLVTRSGNTNRRARFCGHLQANLRALQSLFYALPIRGGIVWIRQSLEGALASRLRARDVNFIGALRAVCKHDDAIRKHFDKSAERRARMNSPANVITQ